MIIKDCLFLDEAFKNKLLTDLSEQEISSFSLKTINLGNSKTKKDFDFEDETYCKSEILNPSIKKKSKDYQQSKKTIRSFWTTFLKPQLSTNLLTKDSDVYKLLLGKREFSLKIIKEVSDHFIKKEGEIGFLKVKEFYNELMNILTRNTNPGFSKYAQRLSNWCLPIITANLHSLSLTDRIISNNPSNIHFPINYVTQENLTITIPLDHYKELQACWVKYHQNQNTDLIGTSSIKQEVKAEDFDEKY